MLVIRWCALLFWPSLGAAVIPCVDKPCSFATNIAWDSQDHVDDRPNTWGGTDYVDSKVPFVNVPKGYRVRLLHVRGDHTAWARKSDGNGTSGVLFGLLATDQGQSPYVDKGLGSAGCSIYVQNAVTSQAPARTPFDADVTTAGLLGKDNVMTVRQATYLNTTGASIHEEVTMVVDFRYEKVE